MLSDFIAKKLKTAKYKILKRGQYFGEIPGVKGVWASAATLEECRSELQEVFEEWLLFKLRDQEQIPGLQTNITRREFARNA